MLLALLVVASSPPALLITASAASRFAWCDVQVDILQHLLPKVSVWPPCCSDSMDAVVAATWSLLLVNSNRPGGAAQYRAEPEPDPPESEQCCFVEVMGVKDCPGT